jgi:menaquinone-specific isochorismate synthase
VSRKEREIDSIDLFAWLNALPLYPKIFWARHDQEFAMAAVGIAASEDLAAMRFGWRHFSPATQNEWRDFAHSFFFLPRFEVLRKNNKTIFAENGENVSPHTLAKKQEPLKEAQNCIQSVSSLPSRKEWIDLIEKALKAIENNRFEKTVLARRVCIDCTSPIDPIALCQSILAVNQTVFLIQPTPASAFLGASPEMLYERRGQTIQCDALAGTRPLHQKQELFTSEKDRREFFIVQKSILDSLAPLCQSIPSASDPAIRTSSHLCHLYSQITGNLKQGMTDEALLDTLHPTPAVGGYPTKEALAFISRNEPFERGLYAAPLGWTSPGMADFTVGIRSCLIRNNRAFLYAGTGIVEGSDPLLEWEESEHKLSQWNGFFKRL